MMDIERRTRLVQCMLADFAASGSADLRGKIVAAAARDPAVLEVVLDICRDISAHNLEMEAKEREYMPLVDEARKVLEQEKANPLRIAAFVRDEGTAGETRRALIDMGGHRQVLPLGEDVSREGLEAWPMVLVDSRNVVVDVLRDYEPSSAELVRVKDMLGEGGQALVESRADESFSVDVPHGLREGLASGDRLLISRNHGIAVRRLPRAEERSAWMLEETPKERFSDVAGQEHAKLLVEERVLWPVLYPEVVSAVGLRRSLGILLMGLSGNGKTLLAKATAGEVSEKCKSVFLAVNGAEIKSEYYGGTSRRIRELWECARMWARRGHVVVIFVDECECLLPQRVSGYGDYSHGADRDTADTWFSEMEGIASDSSLPVVCIGACNVPQLMDPAAISRFGNQAKVGTPDETGTSQIFRVHMNHGLAAEPGIDQLIDRAVDCIFRDEDSTVARLHFRDNRRPTEEVRRSHLVSGRLIKDCVEAAKWNLVRDIVMNGARTVMTEAHLVDAIRGRYAELSDDLDANNVSQYVDMPGLAARQVLEVEKVAQKRESFEYVS